MSDVLVVGMAAVDFIFEVDSMPHKAEKYVATNAKIVGGGGAANAACAIAALGGSAMLSARVGNDMVGRLIVDDLLNRGVDCSIIDVSDHGISSYSSVLIDAQGERQIVNYRGKGLSDDVSSIEHASPGAVLADTRWKAGAIAAMQLAANKNIPGVLDAEAPLDSEMLQLSSHIAFSRQGLESLGGDITHIAGIEEALRNVQDTYNGWVAMTDGSNGVYSLNRGQLVHQAAASVDVVDTLGAGDVWHGAFTYRLACGGDEKSAVDFANAAASLKCTKAGGGRVSPTASEVERFLSSIR